MSAVSDSRRAPRGATLVELLVSLPLAMTVAIMATVLLLRLSHGSRVQSSRLATARELRHAAQVLMADLEPLDGEQLTYVSDTLLQFREQIGVLTLCEVAGGNDIIAAAPRGSSDLWVAALRPSDSVHMWYAAEPARPPVAIQRVLTSAPHALAPANCGTDSTSTRRWRLSLHDSRSGSVSSAPVSLHRHVRYRHYRSGTAWWLGRQSRDASAWETIQPVAGPLRTPANGGLRITARDGLGQPVHIALTTADSVRARVAHLEITMAMPRRTAGVAGRETDTMHVVIPLRANAFRRH
jgi:hypothetical protein